MLSKENRQKYIKSEGSYCPYCHSENITSTENVQIDLGGAWQDIECDDCGKRWTDIYKLVDIQEEE